MKIAKRAIALLLCFCLIFLCCACGGKENEIEAETEKTTDISAESEEIYEIVACKGGEPCQLNTRFTSLLTCRM